MEFAIVFPILFMILLFIMDTGWILYQRAAFDYGYSHASWSLSAADLHDGGGYEILGEAAENAYIPGPEEIKSAIRKGISGSALAGFSAARLSVENVSAEIRNDAPEIISVPDALGEEAEAAIITRRMCVSADLRYEIKVLTPIGQMVMGDTVREEKHLDYERIVGKQIRSN